MECIAEAPGEAVDAGECFTQRWLQLTKTGEGFVLSRRQWIATSRPFDIYGRLRAILLREVKVYLKVFREAGFEVPLFISPLSSLSTLHAEQLQGYFGIVQKVCRENTMDGSGFA